MQEVVFMCIYVEASIRKGMQTFVENCVRGCVFVHMFASVYMCPQEHVPTRTSASSCLFVCLFVCVRMCICYMCICIYVSMYMCIYVGRYVRSCMADECVYSCIHV